MFRLVLLVLMVVTIFMPRRFYRRYMQVMAAVGLVYIALLVVAYERDPNAASLNDLFVVAGFIAMNTVVILTKYVMLKKPTA